MNSCPSITKAAKTNISLWLKCGFTLCGHLFIAVWTTIMGSSVSVSVSHGSEQYLILTFEKWKTLLLRYFKTACRERNSKVWVCSLSLCLVILYSEAYFIIAHDKSIKQKSLTSPYDICCKSKAHAFWIFASTLLIIRITWISIDKLSPVVILITFIWPVLSPAKGAGEDCLVFRCLQILSVWAWALGTGRGGLVGVWGPQFKSPWQVIPRHFTIYNATNITQSELANIRPILWNAGPGESKTVFSLQSIACNM